jgi:hypothetical protein
MLFSRALQAAMYHSNFDDRILPGSIHPCPRVNFSDGFLLLGPLEPADEIRRPALGERLSRRAVKHLTLTLIL